MIRLGIRLTFAAGREAIIRLTIIALAVGLGVAMVFATIAISEGASAQNARGAWLTTGQAAPATTAPSGQSKLWWLVTTQPFENQTIVRVDVAATGPHAPVPPGLRRLPAPGQFYVSPALDHLLHSVPTAELGERFAGHEVGTIGPSALPSQADLVIVVGDTPHALAKAPGASLVSSIASSSSDGGPLSLSTTGLQTLFAAIGIALLFPVLIFIAAATRLSAARREQRLAAMRLVGATPRQVSFIASVEAVSAAVVGVVIGAVVFWLVRPALYHVAFIGEPFSPGDLSVGITWLVVVAVAVPLAAMIAARLSLRRVNISPLGVTRRVTPSAPRVTRLMPLVAGIAVLSYFVAAGHPASAGGQIYGYFLGILLVMVGLVTSGPWFTMAGARLAARRTGRASVLVAGRRLSDNPRAAFRSISGLILALFVTSVSVGVVSTILQDHGTTGNSAASATVVSQPTMGSLGQPVASLSPSTMRQLRAIPGVRGVTIVYSAPVTMKTSAPIPSINGLGGSRLTYGVVACRQLRSTPALGRCAPGARYAGVVDDLGYVPVTNSVTVAAATTWPSATLAHGTSDLSVQMIAVGTTGSTAVINRVETLFERAAPFTNETSLFGQLGLGWTQLLRQLQSASEVVILVSLLVAGCSLAVSMVGGLTERKRAFALLRLAGTPVATLRTVVATETAVPLTAIALGSAVIGLGVAELFLRAQLGLTLRAPGAGYLGLVLGGLAGSYAVISLTLPLLNRLTSPENNRME
ncbi:MAG: FtsX-like permease family protein [Acidimicrobiales bacterium]